MAKYPKKPKAHKLPKRPKASAGITTWERYDERVASLIRENLLRHKAWEKECKQIDADAKKKELLIKKHAGGRVAKKAAKKRK